jgi:glycolate oxidase FAD binding subunit
VTALGSLALGDRTPRRVDEPADAAAVAALLKTCSAAGEAAVIVGGGTLQGIGNAPLRYDRAIVMRRLDRIATYDPRDLTIGIEAGMTIAAVSARLAEERQFIPFDVPRPHEATVGGTLAAGWSGPRRAAYGALRDLVIGSTAALADGSLASAGGMVVKNVTGYDMSKLYVGSLGTLGAIVRANFKTLPRPAVQRLAVAPLARDIEERAVAALAAVTVEPAAALVVRGFAGTTPGMRDDDVRLIVLFEGSAATVDRATRELRSQLGAAGIAQTRLADGAEAERAFQATLDTTIEPLADRSITYRARGLPTAAWARMDAAYAHVERLGLGADAIADLRTGDVYVRVSGATRETLDARLDETDAALRRVLSRATLLAGEPSLRARLDAWGPPPATIATMRALKGRFDPAGTLAPGRYVGGI